MNEASGGCEEKSSKREQSSASTGSAVGKDVPKSSTRGKSESKTAKGKERSKGSQKKLQTPKQRTDAKTSEAKKEYKKISQDQTDKPGVNAEDDKDVISWLNKKISKQNDVSTEVESSQPERTNPSTTSRQRNPQSATNRRETKNENWRKRDTEEEVKKIQSSKRYGKDGREKSGKWEKQPVSGKVNRRKETDKFKPGTEEEKTSDVSHKTQRGKEHNEPQLLIHEKSKDDTKTSQDILEIGTNVKVVNGRYVGGNRNEDQNTESEENPGYVQNWDSNVEPQSQRYTDMGPSQPQVYVYEGLHVYNQPYFDYGQMYNNDASEQQQQWLNYGVQQYRDWNKGHSQSTNDQAVQDKTIEPKSNQKPDSKSSSKKFVNRRRNINVDPNHSVQASALTEQLLNESYECMVCCEKVGCHAPVWSCTNCFHVFHLRCVRKWSKSPAALVSGENGGWRCPACQNINQSPPNVYQCFCGKSVDPVWNPREGITPHSCGELCQKKRESSECPHLCNQLCHPGPCPSCPVMVTKACQCGKQIQQARCGVKTVIQCKEVCQKPLNCDVHPCERVCHPGSCDLCEVDEEQVCYCGNSTRAAKCGSGEVSEIDGRKGYYSCERICQRSLDCGNHTCERVCHQGKCHPCKLKPLLVIQCPCGKTTLQTLLGGDTNQRQTCLDPIPICDKICDKVLPCSPTSDGSSLQHRCKQTCHHGNCGPCDGKSIIVCRCGAAEKEISCSEIGSKVYLCDQRCNQKRQCGRHRCNQKCCTDKDHKCELICGKKLRCGTHTCEEPCHRGYCPQCYMTGFDELTCHCGSSVMYPPIPCGTPPPECTQPCSRQHSCSHHVNHQCHSEDVCPPCTVLTKKMCNGHHELRLNVLCHVTDVSCGKLCGSQLACGHRCIKLCHKPPCDSEKCTQPCQEQHKGCGHPCGTPCHKGTPCPAVPCKVKITINCKCGRRSETVPCLHGGDKTALAQFYQRITTESLANKMKEVQQGQSVDISAVVIFDEKSTRYIECNDECAQAERSRRMAEALGIDDNTEAFCSQRLLFSPFLMNEAKNNLSFVKSVEEAFENLVTITQKLPSGQKSHSFPPMNSNQRRIIHELALHYGCASVSYDAEPKRNTIITATKKSHLPPSTLSFVIDRQINPPAPLPVPFVPSEPLAKARLFKEDKKKTWEQVPDYFADDFDD